MRYTLSILALIFALVCICGISMPAEATEATMDWDSIDWETYNFDEFYKDIPYEYLNDFESWWKYDAPLHTAFYLSTKIEGEWGGDVLCYRFTEAPLTLIEELAKEDPETQEFICDRIAAYSCYDRNITVPKVAAALNVKDISSAEGQTILSRISALLTQYWGDTLPKTGDPVVFIAAALVLSGAGGAVLLDKRKKEN